MRLFGPSHPAPVPEFIITNVDDNWLGGEWGRAATAAAASAGWSGAEVYSRGQLWQVVPRGLPHSHRPVASGLFFLLFVLN